MAVAMTEARTARLKQMPSSCRGVYKLAMAGRSRKAAIKAMCLECTGWDRASIAGCTASACPLFPYRPFVSSEKGE